MSVIVVDDQQKQTILESKGDVVLRDSQGRYLGHLTDAFAKDDGGVTQEDIEMAKKSLASDSRRYTTKEVLEHLRKLSEAQ